ncbi:MAG: hypothetical protein ACXWYS_03930 [Gaiellaceae bacterium]
MALAEDLEAVAQAAAAAFAGPGESLVGVVPVEPGSVRLYLCAFSAGDGQAWLVLDADAQPVQVRQTVRDAASIAALVEYAEELAAGGDLDELRARLVALRLTEDPPGIDEADEALTALQAELGAPPRVASPELLDRVAAATQRLEVALGGEGGSPFAAAMKGSGDAVQAFVADVEAAYKLPLS